MLPIMLIGIPLYSNAAGIVPIVGTLIEKGASVGTTLAFTMSVIGLSLPEAVMLKRVLKMPLMITFFAVIAVAIMPTGFMFHWIYKTIGEEVLTIKVLGSVCANCKKLETLAHQLIDQMIVQAEIIKVTEYPDIMAYNIMSTPGLVINEKVVSTGRISSQAEVITFITNALETASLVSKTRYCHNG